MDYNSPEWHALNDEADAVICERAAELLRNIDRAMGKDLYVAAMDELKAEKHPALQALAEAHPNDTQRQAGFRDEQMRERGLTRAEADRLWERQESQRELNAARAGDRSMRLSARHAGADVAVPIED